jgi:hypothetical protein
MHRARDVGQRAAPYTGRGSRMGRRVAVPFIFWKGHVE